MHLIVASKLPFSIACTSEVTKLTHHEQLDKARYLSNSNFVTDQVMLCTSEEEYDKELHVLKNHGAHTTYAKLVYNIITCYYKQMKNKQTFQDRYDL